MLYCENPVYLKKFGFAVGCGHCPVCLANKRKDWSCRIQLEALSYGSEVAFATLTYAEDNCPQELVYSDIQKFFKKLRKEKKFRYFVSGEYGSKTSRPHWHMILFGLSPLDVELIRSTWNKGFVVVSSFTSGRADYVSSYVLKKLDFSKYSSYVKSLHLDDKDISERFEVLKDKMKIDSVKFKDLFINPMSSCSRRPGLGFEWYQKHKKELLDKNYIVLSNRKYSVPGYFKRNLLLDFPEYREKIVDNGKYYEEMMLSDFLQDYFGDDIYQDFNDYKKSCSGLKNETLRRKTSIKGDSF